MSSIIGQCPMCKEENVILVNHHWYDDKLKLISHHIRICQSCNSKLKTDQDDSHILPSIQNQIEKIKTPVYSYKDIKVTKAIIFPKELFDIIKEKADKRQISINKFVNHAMKQYIKLGSVKTKKAINPHV